MSKYPPPSLPISESFPEKKRGSRVQKFYFIPVGVLKKVTLKIPTRMSVSFSCSQGVKKVTYLTLTCSVFVSPFSFFLSSSLFLSSLSAHCSPLPPVSCAVFLLLLPFLIYPYPVTCPFSACQPHCRSHGKKKLLDEIFDCTRQFWLMGYSVDGDVRCGCLIQSVFYAPQSLPRE